MGKYRSSLEKIKEKLGYDFRNPPNVSWHEDDRPREHVNYDKLNDEDRKFISAYTRWEWEMPYEHLGYTEEDFLEENKEDEKEENAEKVTIKSINKKLGFNYADYKAPDLGLVMDDVELSPMDILTIRELECLSAFNAKKFGWDYSEYGFSDEDLEP